MSPAARALLTRAVLAACEQFPQGDDVLITSAAAHKLAELCAQLEVLAGFKPEGRGEVLQ